MARGDVFSKEVPSLLAEHFEQLHHESGISVEVIKERGYESVLGKKRLEELGEYVILTETGKAKLDLVKLTEDLLNEYHFTTLRETDDVLVYVHNQLWLQWLLCRARYAII